MSQSGGFSHTPVHKAKANMKGIIYDKGCQKMTISNNSFELWKKLYMREIDNKAAAEEARRLLSDTKSEKIRIITIKGKTYKIDNNYNPAKIEELLSEK